MARGEVKGRAPEPNGVPRFHKLNFQMYENKDDPLSWLNRYEQFFCGQRTMEEYKVWLDYFHMTRVA